MSGGPMLELLQNAALLLSLVYVVDLIRPMDGAKSGRGRRLILGLALGLIGVTVMRTCWVLEPGIVLDTRSVLLGVSGLFVGAGPTVLAMLATAAVRFAEGGAGVWTGVSVIFVTGAMGLLWRRRWQPRLADLRWHELYGFGLALHAAKLALFFLLPIDDALRVLSRIAAPVLLVYPLATTALGMILVRRCRQERMAAHLHESEERYRGLFENEHTVMLLTDPDHGAIVDANPAAATYYGWSRETLRAMRIGDLNTLSPEDLHADMDRARRGAESRFMFKHRRADGRVSDVEVFSGPIRMAGRTLLFSIVHDVTDRIRAERRMRASKAETRSLLEDADRSRRALLSLIEDQKETETRLREKTEELERYFANSLDMLCIADFQGRFMHLNDEWEQALGYPVAELEGRALLDFVHPDDRAATLAVMADLSAEREVLSFTNRYRHRDGSYRWIEWRSRPAGGVIYASARDVTEQRSMLEHLQQAQKMESVGRLAGGVAHDFNNMLQTILGNADLALAKDGLGAEVRECLEDIRNAAQRSANLTRQLLAFARKQTIQPRVLDLNATIEQMLKMLRRLIGEQIELVWRPSPGLWPVMMDPSQVDQILANLAVNARDAMPEAAGRLTISTYNGTPMMTAEHDRKDWQFCNGVMLVIEDNGCGMPPEVRSHLFEPFFTTKQLGKGTGLGLATIYGIVTQNQGTIHAFSEPGKGARFEICLPRASEAVGSADTDDEETAVGELEGHETILLVEDEPSVLALSERILADQGYAVLSAASPDEALALAVAHSGPIDLLLTDIVMPGMNGRELHRRLIDRRPGLRVVFMSGYTANVIAHQGVLDEGVDFLQKPFSRQALAAKVREALDRPAPR
jgi:two-component system, cell cycle sensor histidine kinase and response regulator CckA